MSPPVPFTSAIGPVIARYVALKQALGRRFDTQRYLLARFDGFLAEHHATDLTAETFSAWCVSITHLLPSGRRMRMQMVRQFCLYRRRSDPVCFVPDPSQFPLPQPRRAPPPRTRLPGSCARPARCAAGASPLYRRSRARLALVLLHRGFAAARSCAEASATTITSSTSCSSATTSSTSLAWSSRTTPCMNRTLP